MIDHKDTSLLMLLSLRYCMGRMTYMPEMIRDMEVKYNLLNDIDRTTAIRDIDSVDLYHQPGSSLWDDAANADWREFAEYLKGIND